MSDMDEAESPMEARAAGSLGNCRAKPNFELHTQRGRSAKTRKGLRNELQPAAFLHGHESQTQEGKKM